MQYRKLLLSFCLMPICAFAYNSQPPSNQQFVQALAPTPAASQQSATKAAENKTEITSKAPRYQTRPEPVNSPMNIYVPQKQVASDQQQPAYQQQNENNNQQQWHNRPVSPAIQQNTYQQQNIQQSQYMNQEQTNTQPQEMQQAKPLPLQASQSAPLAGGYTSADQKAWFDNCLKAGSNAKSAQYTQVYCSCGWKQISSGKLPATMLSSKDPAVRAKANKILQSIRQDCLVQAMATIKH